MVGRHIKGLQRLLSQRANRVASATRRSAKKARRLSTEPLEPRLVLDSTVVFNEIMYNPAGDDFGREWIELHNQMAVDMDLSLWRLDGAVEFDFPEGTVIPGRGYLVIAADPDVVEAEHGITGVLGPFTGSLSNGGEALELYNNYNAVRTRTGGGAVNPLPGAGDSDDRRLMNFMEFGDGDEWPVEADGSGASLAKIDPDAGSEQAESWTFSNRVGGTPGARNFSDGRPAPVSQITDASGNNRHGIPFSLGTVTGGFEGRAGSFDGASGYVQSPVDINPTTHPQMTFGAWVRSDTTSPSHAIISHDDGGWDRSLSIGSGTPGISPGGENIWNAFNVQGHDLVSNNPTMNLVNRDGAATGVNFTIVGTISGFSNPQNPNKRLTNDYIFVNAGNSPANADWRLAGLTPGRQYDMYFYGGIARDAGMRIDVNGDGSLAGESTRIVPIDSGILVSSVVASATGQILGNVGPGTVGEGNWSGFQLVDRVTGQLISADLQAVNGGFGQQAPLLQSGPVSSATGVGYSAFAGNHEFVGTGVVPDTSTWAFIAGVFNQTTNSMTLYVDRDASTTADAVQAFTDNATAFGTSTLPTNIGRLPSNQWYFDGLIDNAFFASGALSPAQITALRNGGGAAVQNLGASLLAFYPFEDSPPTTDDIIELPAIAINELASSEAALFQVELVNTGSEPLDLAGMTLSTNEGALPEYVFASETLAPGARIVVDENTLGFRPADGDALFLFTAGKLSVVDAVHVDNSPRARFPDATGPWLEPTTTTFGTTNVVDLRDEIVINEIMYHGYPNRGTPPTPATYQTTTLLDWNANWRYNQVGQSVAGGQLPTNWASTMHPVNGSTWFSGAGIFAFEPNGTIAPIGTTLTLGGGRITYYFETEFTVPLDAPDDFALQLEHYIDDGAIFYLNGVEIIDRVNMSASGVTNTTVATAQIEAAPATTTISAAQLAAAGFQKGVPQRLSVEVHQGAAGSSDVVFGTRVHLRTQADPGAPGTPYVESNEDWLELYNRSGATIDLTGWTLRGGVDYDFAAGTIIAPGGYLVVTNDSAALKAKYPAIADRILGNYSGQLANSGELVRLEDPLGNPADEVRYYDTGRWPSAPDGGGSSLELRDPDSDNAQPGAWSASNESSDTAWKTYTYRGIATNDGIGNDVFRELVLGLLDAGEILLDDISVIERPGTAQAVQVIQNGNFETDTAGAAANKWRIIGNHSGLVTLDPTNTANKVLRLLATGATEDKHNHAETTFVGNRPIVVGAEYEISYKAKWISGSNQLNSRLYFNFLQKTTLIDVSYDAGTPGARNSRFQVNAGPTYTEFHHSPVVPKPGEATTVSVVAADPDDIASLTLLYAVNSGAYATAPMTHLGGGRYTGTILGQSAGSVVQFYVQGIDSAGRVSVYPSDGNNSRALYVVEDGAAAVGQLHNVRVIMTPTDRDFLYLNTNRMSNDYLGATVIYDESEVFYDVGVQLKGSAFGRFAGTETGLSVRFNPDELFRGVHETISIERANNKKELLAKHMYGRAGGGLTSFYDDVIRLVAPSSAQSGVALLSMARYSDVFLDETFENGGDGALYNMELLYNPNGTVDGNPESLKLNNPYNHTNGTVVIADRGNDKETYRWNYQMRNARGQDDYGPLIELMQAFSLNGSALDAATQDIIDVDQWMRTWAMFSLNGNDDLYTRTWDHNYRMFVRPEDGKIIGMPWDLDRAFQIATNAPLWGDENLRNVIELPANKRLYYGHLLDMANTTANAQYMTQWATHFGLLTGQSFTNELNYITARSSYVLSQLPAEFAFSIATADPLNVGSATSATLTGRAWLNVRDIRVAGSTLPIDITWTATPQGTSNAGPWADGWQITIPVDSSTGLVTLEAYDHQGNLVGTDTITISSTAPRPIVDQLRIVELMYNPPGNGDGEEFLELMNISGTNIPNLAGVHFETGMTFEFGDVSLAAGERAVIVRNIAAFQAMYGTSIRILGEFPDSALDNAGESLTLVDKDGALVQRFSYDDSGEGWHPTTDGDGYSLVIIDPTADVETWNDGASWRPSLSIGGSPGSDDTSLDGDINGDLRVDLVDLAILQSHFGITSGALRTQGDLNQDGAIDRKDVATLARNFGRNANSAGPPAASDAIVAGTSDRRRDATSGKATELHAQARVRRPSDVPLTAITMAADEFMSANANSSRTIAGKRSRAIARP